MGIVGGGPGSFIGDIHVKSAVLDGQIELVCGAFSSDPANSRKQGAAYYLAPTTPNPLHYEPARLALENGFHVVTDKPLTHNTGDARKLVSLVEETGLIFAVTHAYTGYPMVKEAREMASGRRR